MCTTSHNVAASNPIFVTGGMRLNKISAVPGGARKKGTSLIKNQWCPLFRFHHPAGDDPADWRDCGISGDRGSESGRRILPVAPGGCEAGRPPSQAQEPSAAVVVQAILKRFRSRSLAPTMQEQGTKPLGGATIDSHDRNPPQRPRRRYPDQSPGGVCHAGWDGFGRCACKSCAGETAAGEWKSFDSLR
jgi:hypothetical protein